jgi:hypothetical protein
MRIPHYRQHQIERRQILIGCAGGNRGFWPKRFSCSACPSDGRRGALLVWILSALLFFAILWQGARHHICLAFSQPFIASLDCEFVIEDFYFG